MLLPLSGKTQPFTKKYIMAFAVCSQPASPPPDQTVYLAESDDGSNWTLVPDFIPYTGSVPEIIIRGSKLYVYTPTPTAVVKRYDFGSNTWDASPVSVSIHDSVGNNVGWVDPTSIIDSSGNIVLFFLNTTGISGDPAICTAYPCTKYFDMAVEVPGSDGTQFVKSSGHRASITLQDTLQRRACDPDLFFDGTQYVLYITKANGMVAYYSNQLLGNYTLFSGLPNGFITVQGVTGCGYFENTSSEYWMYVMEKVSGVFVIRRAVFNNFNSQVNSFNTVLSATSIGLPSTMNTESPSFCTNDFLTGIHYSVTRIQKDYLILFPNPVTDNIEIETLKNANIEIMNSQGQIVERFIAKNTKTTVALSKLQCGIYFIKARTDKGVTVKKFIKQ